jgi:hypothetical protein
MARDTAGFTWEPEIPPRRYTFKANVRPITRALPVAKMDISSKKVPKNSATKGSTFILFLSRELFYMF